MAAAISSFRKVLSYHYRIHVQVKRQIVKALNELGQKSIPIPEHIKPSSSSARASQTSQFSKKISASPQRRAAPVSASAKQVNMRSSSQSNQAAAQASASRRREISSQSRPSRTLRKHRKQIANTQADKKGSDSSNMTTLQTSGIDGKGLKINQIR